MYSASWHLGPPRNLQIFKGLHKTLSIYTSPIETPRLSGRRGQTDQISRRIPVSLRISDLHANRASRSDCNTTQNVEVNHSRFLKIPKSLRGGEIDLSSWWSHRHVGARSWDPCPASATRARGPEPPDSPELTAPRSPHKKSCGSSRQQRKGASFFFSRQTSEHSVRWKLPEDRSTACVYAQHLATDSMGEAVAICSRSRIKIYDQETYL